MENASKALIMAAEVLIGILVISLMVYLFATFGSNSAKINKQLEDNKLAEFNSQYDKYVNKDDVTIYDIITVTNLAKENNEYYELEAAPYSDGNYYIYVKINGAQIQEKTQTELTQMIEDEGSKVVEDLTLPKYKCKVIYSPITGRVKTVNFE